MTRAEYARMLARQLEDFFDSWAFYRERSCIARTDDDLYTIKVIQEAIRELECNPWN